MLKRLTMKTKVKVKDFEGKEKVFEVDKRAEDHFDAQRKYRKIVFRNKKAYNRKRKHKQKFDFD